MSNQFKYGSVKIANDLFDQLAKEAANEVYGVDPSETEVEVKNINGNIFVELKLALSENVNVVKTISSVQENVKRVIETMTGFLVKKVNVDITKLSF